MNSSGPKLPDRYAILGKLGAGGMGTVYKVLDKDLNNIVALKVLDLTGGSSNEQIVRFNKEARACARLRHPNIIQILDFGFVDGMPPYMVLEYVDGQTLKARVSEVGPLPFVDAIHVFFQISSALSHAHGQNIIHRDLKSSNILLTENEDGEPIIKLFDFGIAKITGDAEAMKLTASNAFIGTPTHMSPEQINGQEIDARSDIYSLGCVMFEAITGKLPFSSNDIMGLLEMQLHKEAPKVGSLITDLSGGSLEKIVDTCLKKDPAERYQSAEEILTALHDLIEELEQEQKEKDDDKDGDENSSEALETDNKKSTRWSMAVKIGAFLAFLLVFGMTIAYLIKNDPEVSVESARRKIDWQKVLTMSEERQDVEIKFIPDFQEYDILQIPNDGTVTRINLTEPKFPGEIDDQLSSNHLSDQAYEYVSKLTKLKTVKVHRSRLSKQAIHSLAKLPNLTFLDAVQTEFEDTSSLLELKHLTSINWSEFRPDDIRMLKELPLRLLAMESAEINDDLIRAICTNKKVNQLTFNRCKSENASSLLQLHLMPNLNTLAIERSPDVVRNGIGAVSSLKNLRHLRLKNDEIGDIDVAPLANMTWLESLSVQNNPKLTNAALSSFSKITDLKELNLQQCELITMEGIKQFTQATHGRCGVVHEDEKPPQINAFTKKRAMI